MNELLKFKIESILNGKSLKALVREREKLTQCYKERSGSLEIKSLSSDNQRLSYLAARFPATYAAVYKVLMELVSRGGEGGASVTSLLDVGAGPGTAFLAASEVLPSLERATLMERDPGFISIGKQLTAEMAEWICQDITSEWGVEPHDLVIASYALNELKESVRLEVVEKLWRVTRKFLVLVEPGSKVAFEFLSCARQRLLVKGAHLVAPCPHANACPLAKGTDWCHFSARVARSSIHRKTKDATLNYEDEKFSYLIFSRGPLKGCEARVLRRPFKGEGFVKLQLCSEGGIVEKTVTKKNKPQYLHAKKIEWGDGI